MESERGTEHEFIAFETQLLTKIAVFVLLHCEADRFNSFTDPLSRLPVCGEFQGLSKLV